VGEKGWLPLLHSVQHLLRPGWAASQPFEFVHGPSKKVLIDAPQQGKQLGVVEDPVIVDPASHLGIDGLGDAGQVRAHATVEVQALICWPFAFFACELMAGRKFTKNPFRPRASLDLS